jgi:hypothetical protein
VLTFALSDHEIGLHIPSSGANGEDHVGGDVHDDDQVLGLRKEKREKQKAQGKGILDRSSLFW